MVYTFYTTKMNSFLEVTKKRIGLLEERHYERSFLIGTLTNEKYERADIVHVGPGGDNRHEL